MERSNRNADSVCRFSVAVLGVSIRGRRQVLTDEYVTGRFAGSNSVVPLQWVDICAGEETTIVRIPTNPLCRPTS